jgi:hypothetical protein
MSSPTGGDREWQSSFDERDPDSSRDIEEREQWLRDNVPPHHSD